MLNSSMKLIRIFFRKSSYKKILIKRQRVVITYLVSIPIPNTLTDTILYILYIFNDHQSMKIQVKIIKAVIYVLCIYIYIYIYIIDMKKNGWV